MELASSVHLVPEEAQIPAVEDSMAVVQAVRYPVPQHPHQQLAVASCTTAAFFASTLASSQELHLGSWAYFERIAFASDRMHWHIDYTVVAVVVAVVVGGAGFVGADLLVQPA